MEGKNCFRTRWTQEPIFSGGALASLALPVPPSLSSSSSSPAASPTPPRLASQEVEECLVMACGDAVNVVRATTGEVLCSYTLPMEDVILHVDAVTVPSPEETEEAMTTGAHEADTQAASASSGKAKKAQAKASKKKAKAAVKTEEPEDGEEESAEAGAAAELRAPPGTYIAVGTRGLQIYVLRVCAVAEGPATTEAEEGEGVTKSKKKEKEAEEGEDGTQVKTEEGEEGEEEAATSGAAATVMHYTVELLRNWTAAQHAISVVHFSRSGTYLISGATDGSLKAWNVFHHHLTHNLICAHSSLVQCVCLDNAESLLAVGSFEGHVTVFDFVAKKMVAAGRPHVQAVESMAFSEGLTHVYSIARDRKLAVSKLPAPEQRGTTELAEARAIVVKEHVSAAVFDGAGLLHVGSMDGVVSTYRVGETEAVQLVRRLPKPPAADAEDGAEETFVRSLLVAGAPKGANRRRLRGFEVHDVPHAPETASLYVGDAGFNIQLVAPSTSDRAAYAPQRTLVGFLDQLLDVKLFPATSPLHRAVVTNSKDVRLYASDGCVSSQTLRGHRDIVLSCAVSSDGAWIATGAKDAEVRVWSSATCETVVRGVGGHTQEITSVSFNGKQTDTYLLLFSVSSDENLRLWDIGVPLAERADAAQQQGSRGGSSSSSGAKKAALPVTDIQHRSGVNAAHSGPVYTVAVAPNDQYVATGGKDKAVNVWNITGKKIFREASLKGHRRGISSLAFSPVDRVLASASNDGSVRLWSLVSLTCLKSLQVDRTSVLQLGFFNKGTQIVTGNAEGVLRVWAIASAESVWSAEAHAEKIWALAVEERDGGAETVFYSGAADGVLIATEDITAAEVQRVKEDRHEMILQEQALANALRKGEFSEAFMLALRLSHPRHLRQVLVRWCAKDSKECEHTLRAELLPSLDGDQMTRLLQYTREWITNSRHCMVATLVLYVLVSSRHFEEVAKVPAMAALVEPLLAYTRKHSQRQHDLLRRTYYIDYVIRGLAPNALTSLPPFVEAKAAEEPLAKRVRAE